MAFCEFLFECVCVCVCEKEVCIADLHVLQCKALMRVQVSFRMCDSALIGYLIQACAFRCLKECIIDMF